MLDFYAVHKHVSKKLKAVVTSAILPFMIVSPVTFSPDTATAAPHLKSTKRGIAYGGHSAADFTALSKGINWWYNWSPTPEAGAASLYKSFSIGFSPMVWGGTPNAGQLALAIPDGPKIY